MKKHTNPRHFNPNRYKCWMFPANHPPHWWHKKTDPTEPEKSFKIISNQENPDSPCQQ